MIRIVIILFFSFLIGPLVAQSDVIYDSSEELGVDSLINLHKEFNENYSSVMGYRVQIFKGSGNSALENAELMIEEFYEKELKTTAYISFMEPYYRIRVGDYKTRLEALSFLNKIKDEYPSAFVIQDKIELVELSKYQKTNNYEQENNSRY